MKGDRMRLVLGMGVLLVAGLVVGVVLGWQGCAVRGASAVREQERAVQALERRVVERGLRVRRLEVEAERLRVVLEVSAAMAQEWETVALALRRRVSEIERRRDDGQDDEDEVRSDARVDSMASRLCASVGAAC